MYVYIKLWYYKNLVCGMKKLVAFSIKQSFYQSHWSSGITFFSSGYFPLFIIYKYMHLEKLLFLSFCTTQ